MELIFYYEVPAEVNFEQLTKIIFEEIKKFENFDLLYCSAFSSVILK